MSGHVLLEGRLRRGKSAVPSCIHLPLSSSCQSRVERESVLLPITGQESLRTRSSVPGCRLAECEIACDQIKVGYQVEECVNVERSGLVGKGRRRKRGILSKHKGVCLQFSPKVPIHIRHVQPTTFCAAFQSNIWTTHRDRRLVPCDHQYHTVSAISSLL